MTQGYNATDIEIVLKTDGGVFIPLHGSIGSYRSALNAIIDTRYMLEDKFPTRVMTERSHTLDLTSVVYDDAQAGDTLRARNRAGDTEVTYAIIHEEAERFGPIGKAILGSVPLAPDNGIFTLSNSNLGTGKVEYRTFRKFTGQVTAPIAIAAAPVTLYAYLRSKGTATSIVLTFDVSSTDYDADIPVADVPNFLAIDPADSTNTKLTGSQSADLTVAVTPSTATIDLVIGLEAA